MRIDRFHLAMAAGTLWLVAVTITTYLFEGRHGHISGLLALGVVLAGAAPFPLYLREKGHPGHAGAVLSLMWAAVLIALVPVSVGVAARVNLPLRDGILVKWDRALGVNVPAIAAWSSNHQVGWLISSTYPLLIWVVASALILPALTGRVRVAREFVLGNLIAFAVGIPLFALMPAVGPWYGLHFQPNPMQLAVQDQLVALRGPGSSPLQLAGVVCFPSFHIIWAILAAAALCNFRWIRIPAAAVCLLIAMSTVTSGWHYFADVVAGTLLAALSIYAARRILIHDPVSPIAVGVDVIASASGDGGAIGGRR